MNIKLETQNRRTAIISFVVSVSLLLMLASGIAGAAVVLWNKLGSETGILNSEIGPGVQLTSYKFTDWQEAEIAPAQFGSGLFVNHDIGEGWTNDGGNFFAVDLSETTLTAERGTIEFWFKFQYDSSTHNHAYFLNTADEFANHFTDSTPHADVFFNAYWNGWDYGSYGKRFCFNMNGVNTCTPDYSAGPGGELEFDVGTIMHFAFVWDIDGIDETEDTVRIYVNGEEWADAQSSWSTTGYMDQYLYIGTRPNYSDSWDHYYNAVKGVTDNIIIRDMVKTEFSDRFTEDPTAHVGGSVTGIIPETVDCLNETTGQDVVFALDKGSTSWNCEAEGLVAGPNDRIVMTVAGSMPREFDFNGDGCIDVADVQRVIDEAQRPEPRDLAFDVNGDGAVNIADARALVLVSDNPGAAPCE
jgi:hypothetical protein